MGIRRFAFGVKTLSRFIHEGNVVHARCIFGIPEGAEVKTVHLSEDDDWSVVIEYEHESFTADDASHIYAAHFEKLHCPPPQSKTLEELCIDRDKWRSLARGFMEELKPGDAT